MKAIFVILTLLAPSLAAAAETRPAETRPIVVELFTSQGCSSCPPADAFLGELAKRAEIVALGFHITYWDGAQWRDPLSLQAATDRQVAYDRRLTGGQVYTPQMVIDGAADAIGSDRAEVLAAIAKAHPVATATVAFAGDRKSVAIGAGTAGGGATVLLARYALSRSTQVKGGENAGRATVDVNGVTALTTLGTWNGKSISFAIAPPGDNEGLAVLIQAPDGSIQGAGKIETTSPPQAPRA